jgi:predicted transcriptional regulator of viral defense system
MNARRSKSADFFDTHPVFRSGEFVAVHTQQGHSAQTSHNLLAHHLATGSILRVRRGLYATVPRGAKPENAAIDPFLVASHLTDDAVVAYHAALQFAGKNYSVWRRYHFLTRLRARPFRFRDVEFVPVQVPARLRRRKDADAGVVEERHAGGRVRVTTLERTLVDVLDAPEKAGGWEEIWRSLEMVSFFDLDAVIGHTRALGSALTAARVGFFLEQHQSGLMVEAKHLARLQRLAPTQPRYLGPEREPGKLVRRWNLVVPDRVLRRSWEEPG